MGLDLEYTNGQTPLGEEEKPGLLIQSVATRGELDEFEHQNIEKAIQWTINRRFTSKNMLTEMFIRNLHKRMYGDVWEWAGEFRRTNKNLGVQWTQIPIEIKKLLDDTEYWIQHNSYSPDEIALRFKHRLVSIHCFSNGNGRHSRLMADIIIEKLFSLPVFTWGAKNVIKDVDLRKEYINSLHAADQGDYTSLLSFARK